MRLWQVYAGGGTVKMYSLRIDHPLLPLASLTEAEAAMFIAGFEPDAREGRHGRGIRIADIDAVR